MPTGQPMPPEHLYLILWKAFYAVEAPVSYTHLTLPTSDLV